MNHCCFESRSFRALVKTLLFGWGGRGRCATFITNMKQKKKKVYMLQGKHCEFHNSNQVTILPSFKHTSQEKKLEMMGVLFYRLCILDQVCGGFLFDCRRF